MLFLINDYLDHYVYPIFDIDLLLNDLKYKVVNKSDMRQAKLRQMMYKRLLEDFSVNSKNKQTGNLFTLSFKS